jgi:hypothetical protein
MQRNEKLRNPYIAGRALGQEHGFFGRTDVLTLVATILSTPENNAITLSMGLWGIRI